MTELEKAKSKIQKLLAMASEDSNASEAEIQTAIAKARLLMVKYKLSELDLNASAEELKIVTKEIADLVFSVTKNYWISDLAKVICDNYCCRMVHYHRSGAKTRTIGIVGAETDIEMVETILKYTADCILTKGEYLKYNALRKGYTHKDATSIINAYGNGFVRGLAELFEEQNKEDEACYELMLVNNKEADEYVKNLPKSKVNLNKAKQAARQFDRFAVIGYTDGKAWSYRDKLAMA